jgi:hypothetical protein
MRAINAVMAGALALSSGPAMAAVSQADLSLWGGAPRAITEIGQPVTIALAVGSLGPDAARAVVLSVEGTDIDLTHSSDRRCMVRAGGAVCTLRTLPAGAQWSLSFTGIARSSKARLEAWVQADDSDPDFDNNSIHVDPVIGHVAVEPQRVAARQAWNGGAGGGPLEVSAGLELVNDTTVALSYQATITPVAPPGVKSGQAWATVTPSEGSVLENSSEGLKLVMSALGRAPGLHRAVLHFDHDSPFSLADVPLSFTVAFWDVPAEDPADPYVHALAGARIASGCEEGLFCPQAPLTRAAAAVWLLRGKEGAAYLPPAAEGKFEDVPVDSPEAPYIEELARRGVTAGCGGERFCPEQPICRAELAVMVLRLLEGGSYTPPRARGLFRDLSPRRPMAAWLEDAASRSLIGACPGRDGGNVCPGQAASRSDAAIAIVKAFEIPTL